MFKRRAILLVLVVFAHVCDGSLLQNIRKVVGPKGALHNGGESMLNVNSTILPSGLSFDGMKVNQHKARKINISEAVGNIQSIRITSGNGSCVIHMLGAPTTDGNFFQQLSFYTNQLTPIHGIYLLSFTAVAIVIFWACCKCRKRERQGDGVPYQELEMAQAGSVSSLNVETAEGWDQDWGDDWEEGGVKSLGGNHLGNISSNGLNSRSSSKDGWEGDWND